MKSVRMKHYVPKLKEMYPGLDEKIIKQIINQGCHNINNHLKDGNDILIESSRIKVKLLIYQFRDYLKESQR
jgi:hypothetical protein